MAAAKGVAQAASPVIHKVWRDVAAAAKADRRQKANRVLPQLREVIDLILTGAFLSLIRFISNDHWNSGWIGNYI